MRRAHDQIHPIAQMTRLRQAKHIDCWRGMMDHAYCAADAFTAILTASNVAFTPYLPPSAMESNVALRHGFWHVERDTLPSYEWTDRTASHDDIWKSMLRRCSER